MNDNSDVLYVINRFYKICRVVDEWCECRTRRFRDAAANERLQRWLDRDFPGCSYPDLINKRAALAILLGRFAQAHGADPKPFADYVAGVIDWQDSGLCAAMAHLEILATPISFDGNAPPEGTVATNGFLGGADLADALGVHSTRRDAFFQKLSRLRASLGDSDLIEVSSPRPHNPRYLYRADSPKLIELATGYKDKNPA